MTKSPCDSCMKGPCRKCRLVLSDLCECPEDCTSDCSGCRYNWATNDKEDKIFCTDLLPDGCCRSADEVFCIARIRGGTCPKGKTPPKQKSMAAIQFDNKGKAEIIPDEVEDCYFLQEELAWHRAKDRYREQVLSIAGSLLIGAFFLIIGYYVCEWAWFGIHTAVALDPSRRITLTLMMYCMTSLLVVIYGIQWWAACLTPIEGELMEAGRIAGRYYRRFITGWSKAGGDEL